MDDPRSIAYVRCRTGLGDLLCTWPAVRALRGRFPRARIVLVTYAEMTPVVERMRPYVDELLAFPGDPGIPERPPRPGWERWHETLEPFDLAVQAYGARPAVNGVVGRMPAAARGGFLDPGPLGLPYPHHLHEVDRHLELVRRLGAQPRGRELEFPVSEADEREAAAVVHDAGLDGDGLAVLHPGATSPSRQWPLGRFAEVGRALRGRGLALAVTGVPGEEDRTREVAAAAGGIDLCGRTSLGGFAALLGRADLLVSNDTGTAHLAAALRVPSVVAFLSGDPVRWAHPDPRHRVARVDVGCNPCSHLSCPIDHPCARRLEPAAVLRQVELALRSS